MRRPLLSLCRRLALRRYRTPVRTALLPLKELRSAVVFVDAEREDADGVCGAVRDFFDSRGISVRILCPQKRDLNWMGFRKARVRASDGPLQEDFFLSLAASPDNFAAEYEARRSPARFKAGCVRLPGDVFDLVVTPAGEAESGGEAVFSAMTDYLQKIR